MSLFKSTIYHDLFNDYDVDNLFNDEAEINALIRVEASLAKVQGELGVIPKDSAQVIHQSLMIQSVDSGLLTASTAKDGIPVPALINELRKAMNEPEHAQYLHWGATSQDIMDTGLVLRLAEVCSIVEVRLKTLLSALAKLAEAHAELPMAARTRSQIATPTSFGAVVVTWGLPFFDHLEVLNQLKPRLLKVSLAGASGNSAVLGESAAAVRQALARELALNDSEFCWHSDRSSLIELTALLTRISGSLAKIGADCVLAGQSEVAELRFSGGGSSTMPQKNNPVIAETLQSLFQFNVAMDGLMVQALPHRQQRDAGAWACEWLALPQICVASAKALALALDLIDGLEPDAGNMAARLNGQNDLIYAEAATFKLAEVLPRPEAQAQVKQMCAEAVSRNVSLQSLLVGAYAELGWGSVFKPEAQLGDAVEQVRLFVERVGGD